MDAVLHGITYVERAWVAIVTEGKVCTGTLDTSDLVAWRRQSVVGLTLNAVHTGITTLGKIVSGTATRLFVAEIKGAIIPIITLEEHLDAYTGVRTTGHRYTTRACTTINLYCLIGTRETTEFDFQILAALRRITFIQCTGVPIITEVVLSLTDAVLTIQDTVINRTDIAVITVRLLSASLLVR